MFFYFCFELGLHHICRSLLHQLVELNTVDKVDWVEYVSLGLGHLLSLLIFDQACDVHFLEWDLTGKFQSHHDHARDPEKYDVKAGYQHVSRMKTVEKFTVIRPAQR